MRRLPGLVCAALLVLQQLRLTEAGGPGLQLQLITEAGKNVQLPPNIGFWHYRPSSGHRWPLDGRFVASAEPAAAVCPLRALRAKGIDGQLPKHLTQDDYRALQLILRCSINLRNLSESALRLLVLFQQMQLVLLFLAEPDLFGGGMITEAIEFFEIYSDWIEQKIPVSALTEQMSTQEASFIPTLANHLTPNQPNHSCESLRHMSHELVQWRR